MKTKKLARSSILVGAKQVEGQPGIVELGLAAADWPTPSEEFFANTAIIRPRSDGCRLGFGQVWIDGKTLSSALVIDMPRSALPTIAASFDAKFRAAIDDAANAYGAAFTEEPLSEPREFTSLQAHLLRIQANAVRCLMDFVELEPVEDPNKFKLIGRVRVRTTPAIAKYAVHAIDTIHAKLKG